ncbi:MAG: HlyD family efflux transporter periplasmic adaptor subunit [Fuerstiella sp.]
MTVSASTTRPAQDPLAQARGARVTLRTDLQVSRQLYQGDPVYVVHDPVAFRTHRLSVQQYRILAVLNPDQTLAENFQTLVAKQEFDADEEKVFLDLVSSFARLSLVMLPGASGARLFEQHQKLRAMRRRGRILGILFLQIPLVNPDHFLTRTIGRMSWLFTKTFLAVWLLGMVAAGTVIVSRFDDLIQPLNGILATKNLPFLWLAFVLLKIWHELGHGYACKVFGGFVPEMGTVLIAGTPAAFVDASSAWSFPERYKRLVVMCGGMYFESLVFIPAVFVWAFSSSPMWSSCAYQLVIMASLVTLLFNANPLMKFDGYFILSELIGMPNLRPRADAQIKRLLVSATLGLRPAPSPDSAWTRLMLVTYGVAAVIYKFFVVISIAMVVAIRFPMIGLGLAAFHVTTTVGMGVHRMAKFLLTGKETAPVRGRARTVAAIVLLGLPIALCLVPVPFGVVVHGLVSAETEHYVNVDSPGRFEHALVASGQLVQADTPLLQLTNQRLQEDLTIAEAALREAELRWNVLQASNLTEAARQQATVRELRQQVREISRRVGKLVVTAPASGRVVRLLAQTERGRFLDEGTPLAVVADGKPLLRTWVNEDQLGSIRQTGDSTVRFRIPGRSTTTFRGRVVRIEPAAEDVFPELALTYLAGGEILINPDTQRPFKPVFQIDIEPVEDVLKLTEHGARVMLNLPRRYESVAGWSVRKCMRFIQQLLVA